jgi:hypothetical protein
MSSGEFELLMPKPWLGYIRDLLPRLIFGEVPVWELGIGVQRAGEA